MAGEVQLEHTVSGQTLYFLVRNATGSIWNGTAFEAYQTADLGTQYALAMTEQGTASRYYVGDFPAAAAGVYHVTVRIKASGSHAETDVTAGSGKIEWDGSAVVSLYSRLAPTTAGRTLDVTATGAAGVDWGNVENQSTSVNLSATTTNLVNTVTTYTGNTVQTGDSYAIVNSGTHGNAAIKGYVDDIGTAGAGLTALPWNAAWDAEVQSEVEDAIVAHRLDELLNADSDIDGAAPPTVGSVFHELLSKTAGSFTFDQTTDSLEALRDRGDAAWITATGFSTLDAAGVRTAVGLASANLDTQLSAIKADTAAILDDTGTSGVVVASGSKTGYALSATGTDLVLADGKTLPQTLQIIAAVCAGKVTGAGSGTEVFKGVDGSTTRVTVTVDADGNRSGVTYG